jgi:hypothetical protein
MSFRNSKTNADRTDDCEEESGSDSVLGGTRIDVRWFMYMYTRPA